MLIGPVELATLPEWEPSPGSLVTWHPKPASRAAAAEAPVSPVPASYIQERHLRNYAQQAEGGSDHSRLLIAVCDVFGKCDIRAMTYVINAHLRRHDTYRSWFEYQDADHIVRHTIADPADIEFAPTEHGEMDAAQLRERILATPHPLEWDCFSFGVVQCADRFTFYASIDHLHADGQFVGVGLMEFQTMYAALVMGEPPVAMGQSGSYDDYCVAQRKYTTALTADTPEVRRWVDFAEANAGSFPDFPLPLGDRSKPHGGDLLSVTLLDEKQTERFESACLAAGSRFIGGMFACIALALYELTGAEVYAGTTPKDTRSNQAELTTQGWFTGLTPVTVPVVPASFADTAKAAQLSFDQGLDLAQVPFERVVELAPSLSRPHPTFTQVNFFDALAGPLAMLTKMFAEVTMGAYSDGRFTYPLSTIVGRFDTTTVSVLFPDNPVARESITHYVAALKSVCVRAADGWTPSRVRDPAELSRQSAS